jgi:hypothetical protein
MHPPHRRRCSDAAASHSPLGCSNGSLRASSGGGAPPRSSRNTVAESTQAIDEPEVRGSVVPSPASGPRRPRNCHSTEAVESECGAVAVGRTYLLPRLPPATTTRRPSKSKAVSCVLQLRSSIPGKQVRRRSDLNQSNSRALVRRDHPAARASIRQHRPGPLRASAPNDGWNRPAQRMPPSVRINF